MAKYNAKYGLVDKVKDKIKAYTAPDAIPESKWEEMNLRLKKMRNRRRLYVGIMALELAIIGYLLFAKYW